jgi:hypothetical protein
MLSSNLVAPTILQNGPFAQNVEGLSYFADKNCVVESAVQISARGPKVSFRFRSNRSLGHVLQRVKRIICC